MHRGLLVGAAMTLLVLSSWNLASQEAPTSPDPEVRKLALVIGASNYSADPLPNAVSDANAFQLKLQSAGFAKSDIAFVPDPSNVNDILDPVIALAAKASNPNDPVIFVFYFAGHGFQDGPWPYIVPTGATDYLRDSLSIDKVMQVLTAHRVGIAIFLLDSCRTGLSGNTLERMTGNATDSRRMAVLSLATELNAPAADSSPVAFDHSPYTTALLKHISREAVTLSTILDDIRPLVEDLSQKTQRPVVIQEAGISRFLMRPSKEQVEREDEYWQTVAQTKNRSCVEAFEANHPGSHKLRAAVNLIDSGALQEKKEGDSECPEDPMVR
jgi:uncharacterized caspase-like protein